jgi:GT2 family glycosyltransferase
VRRKTYVLLVSEEETVEVGDDLIATAIIVNWQGGEVVAAAIRSLLAQTVREKLEIVVVDNASSDGSAEEIEREFTRDIRLIRSDSNLGFAEGNNLGLRHSRGEYVLLLNNDAEVAPDWAEQLISVARENPEVGMCTSKILCHDDRDRIDNAGFSISRDGLNRSRGHLCRDDGSFDGIEETLFASGCAALYRRRTVMEVGGFDPDFFAYGDDADLGLKIRMLGYICLYVPGAVAYHRQSSSVGQASVQKLYWIERNRVWVLVKYLPVMWIIMSPWFTVRRLFGSWRAAKRGQGIAGKVREQASSLVLLRTVAGAWLDALIGIPKMWRRRRRLWKSRAVSRREWRALLKRFEAPPEEMTFGEPVT